MTQRERQILRWIEENPLISQQELAEKAGITRSSVAVHISNLMKKGYIAGEGLCACAPAPYVVVVGGVEHGHRRREPLRASGPGDSNPGTVTHECGRRGTKHRPQHQPFGHGSCRMLSAVGD